MEIRKVSVVLIVIVGIVLVACAPTSPVAGVSTNAPRALPTEILTQVPSLETASDEALKNGVYLIDGQTITLANGVAETELAPGSASKQVTRFFGNAADIDLNSDGLMDSAFLLQQENGGSGTFYYVVAALKTTNGYLGTNAIFLGDRIAPQSTNIDPNNPSQFIVNYADRNAGEPMSSAPTVGVSKTFKIEIGSLVEVVASPTQTP
jgi:hypothetical protein